MMDTLEIIADLIFCLFQAYISSEFGVSAHGPRNSKSHHCHCVYMHTILIVARKFSAYVNGNFKSRHRIYMHTILIVARKFSAYIHGNFKSRNCAYMGTILIVAQIFLHAYVEPPDLFSCFGVCTEICKKALSFY